MIVKVMICLPMSGREESEINARLDEIMDNYGPYFSKKYGGVEWHVNISPDDETIEKTHPCASLYFLGRGIMEHMSNADIVLFDSNYDKSRGCCVEMDICEKYSKQCMVVSEEHLSEQMEIMSLGLTLPGVYKLVGEEDAYRHTKCLDDDYKVINNMLHCDYIIIDDITDHHCHDATAHFMHSIFSGIRNTKSSTPEDNTKIIIATARTFTKGRVTEIKINRDLFDKLSKAGYSFKRLDNLDLLSDE